MRRFNRDSIKNMAYGAGTVLSIAPSSDYSRIVPKASVGDRMRQRWERVGRNIQTAMDRFEHEQEEK